MLPLAGSLQQQTPLPDSAADVAALPSITALLRQIGAGQTGKLLDGAEGTEGIDSTEVLTAADEETAAALLTGEEAALLAAETGAVASQLPPPADTAAAVRDTETTAARSALTGLAAGAQATATAASADAAEPATDTDPLNTAVLTTTSTDSRPPADEAFSTSLLTPQNNTAASTPATPASVLAAAAPAETSISTAATVAAQKNAATSLPDELSQALREERLNFGNDRSTWGGALGARVVAMVMDDVQQARIHLDPPELGSLEIRLQVQQDQATVQVQVQNGQVRDALESGAQRLRDALAAQGLQLAGYDVSERGQQSQAQQGQSGQGGQGDRSADGAEGEWLATDDSQSLAPAGSLNLLDTYA
ncbi:flagellar hook-length control protein FliK [Venatoribacter cucullus]|uniref:flagellar hook-length control protein FliK n=1 Tax=Venatoribacter cucullus TaxID=2661630 RepID=UPI0022407FB5|nr:flagellar hook-length control protein FliK [Venatoribacter cucullus]